MGETIQGFVRVHFRTFQEDGLWVGECLELGVSTSAATQDEAGQGAIDATALYLETLADQHELQRVLEERGVQLVSDDAPALEQLEERTIPVPAGVA